MRLELGYDVALVNSAALRTLIVYAVVLPLAVFIGWTTVDLTNWDRTSFATIAAVVFVLILPLLLKWHYAAMILSWNTTISIFFLPGKPDLWMLLVGINFGIAILNRIIQKRPAFHSAPAITLPLLALASVVLVTAMLRGGVGLSSLGGSSIGGKGYYYILASIVGYFALASQSIPREKANLYVGLFFISGLVTVFSHLIYYAGPSFYFLYLVFPIGFAAVQASTEVAGGIVRVGGLSVAGSAIAFYFMAVHGIRGMLRKWWRVLILIGAVAGAALSGYRSSLALVGLVILVLFAFEGLFRTAVFPAVLLAAAIGFAGLSAVSTRLPAPVQRTISFLPVEIDPMVKRDAMGSIDWRLQIWRTLLPDLPKYLWLGKGYAMNPTDLYLAVEAVRRGRSTGQSTTILTGDYHNGPLSVYVPFGSGGALAFLAFVIVAIRSLYLNYRYGANELRMINRFLLAYFCARMIFFLLFFGSFYSDLFQFTGVLGLSVALNHGVSRKPALVRQPAPYRRPLRESVPAPGAA